MDLFHVVALLIAGVIGGTISTVIGGASIVTFPVLLATGIPPVTAIVSNTVALVPGNLLAAMYDRAQMPPLGRSFATLVAVSVSGALLGAVLLLQTPERVFAVLVPLLLGFATLLFGYAPRIAAWLRTRSRAVEGQNLHRWSGSVTALVPVSIYGGYFGAGLACWCSACSRSRPAGIIALPMSRRIWWCVSIASALPSFSPRAARWPGR